MARMRAGIRLAFDVVCFAAWYYVSWMAGRRPWSGRPVPTRRARFSAWWDVYWPEVVSVGYGWAFIALVIWVIAS